MERQTLKQALSEDRDDGSSSEAEELPPEEIHMVIHEAMNQHYRAQLDQAVPILGNISPRKAAKSKAGREKLVAWLKGLENMNARHDADDPMSSYDTTWMWEELGISNMRK